MRSTKLFMWTFSHNSSKVYDHLFFPRIFIKCIKINVRLEFQTKDTSSTPAGMAKLPNAPTAAIGAISFLFIFWDIPQWRRGNIKGSGFGIRPIATPSGLGISNIDALHWLKTPGPFSPSLLSSFIPHSHPSQESPTEPPTNLRPVSTTTAARPTVSSPHLRQARGSPHSSSNWPRWRFQLFKRFSNSNVCALVTVRL